jgi:phosphoribosyl 1,2-cyclic phosphate phosphodiesterase
MTDTGIKIILLGTGSSGGVPLIGGADGGGEWGACDLLEPKNRRKRASVFIETQGVRLLVDTGPDLRQQMLENRLSAADAILYSHNHADHLHGIDEVRSLNYTLQKAIPAYTDAFYADAISGAFPYIFNDPAKTHNFYKPAIDFKIITPPAPFQVGDVTVQPFYQDHGYVQSIGYRIGNFAYCTDVKAFPPASEKYLENLDLWVLAAVQRGTPHNTHAHLELALEWVAKYRPRLTIFTHMNNSMDYATLARELPPHIRPGYDGMVLSVPDD